MKRSISTCWRSWRRPRPEWQLLLVGALDLTGYPGKADALAALPNVHWLGRLPAPQVPSAIASMDVCLLPYERNEWTANIDSLKLYEYLACGKPVVSTDVPAARAFEPLVRIADDPALFVAAIEAALADNALGGDRRTSGRGRRQHLGHPRGADRRPVAGRARP